MLVIVAHHYVVNSGLIECIGEKTHLHFVDYFLLLFGWGGKTGINCFVLITGYFMCTSHITKQKFCKLLGEYYFYTIGIWAVFLLTGYEAFSVKGLLQVLFPFFTVSNGFTSCFLLFYLLIPFLNKLIHALTQREHFLLLLWGLGIYAVLPSFAKTEVTFNYVTWFSILYVLAAYLRLYPQPWFESSQVTGLLALASLVLSWGSVVVLAWFSRAVGKGIWLSYFFVSDSNKVLALATGVSLFLFFRSLKLGYSKCINTIAASTFGVLMIHGQQRHHAPLAVAGCLQQCRRVHGWQCCASCCCMYCDHLCSVYADRYGADLVIETHPVWNKILRRKHFYSKAVLLKLAV